MRAIAILHAKEIRDDGTIVAMVVWRIPQPLKRCDHLYKYRLFFGNREACYVRYDNERGKGDHRHVAGIEESYRFVSLAQLLDAFQEDVEKWSKS